MSSRSPIVIYETNAVAAYIINASQAVIAINKHSYLFKPSDNMISEQALIDMEVISQRELIGQ
jgi:hypothetical protein